jgi:hypothetical protein
MKYSIKEGAAWYCLNTNFVVTKALVELIINCRGVIVLDSHIHTKYQISIKFGELFDIEETKQNIAKIMDAYILANPKGGEAEDKAMRKFAKENELFRFLNNYDK